MDRRAELHSILCTVVDHVYFQPPESIKLVYPCIVYNKEPEKDLYADNLIYVSTDRYSLTVIDANPDTQIPRELKDTLKEYIKPNRYYVSSNLNHYAFTVYY